MSSMGDTTRGVCYRHASGNAFSGLLSFKHHEDIGSLLDLVSFAGDKENLHKYSRGRTATPPKGVDLSMRCPT